MTTSYLVPCDCGEETVVQPRQAGQEVRCACGKSLSVPTMLEMAKLQRSEAPPDPHGRSTAWGWRQSVVLLGVAVAVLTVIIGIHVGPSRPTPPRQAPVDTVREFNQNLTPMWAWRQWRYFRASGLNRQEPVSTEQYAEDSLRWWLQVGAVVAIGLVGLCLIIVPLLVKQRPPGQPSGE